MRAVTASRYRTQYSCIESIHGHGFGLDRVVHAEISIKKLVMHPDKISIKTIASGVDFLGWVHFPDHRVLRTTTKKRMFRNIKIKEAKPETVQSYLGLVSRGNNRKLRQEIKAIRENLTKKARGVYWG